MAKFRTLTIFLVIVTILEALLFGFIQGGWSSFVYVLIDTGFYADLCISSDGINKGNNISFVSYENVNKPEIQHSSNTGNNSDNVYTIEQPDSIFPPGNYSIKTGTTSCKLQQEQLHLLYTIAFALLEIISVFWGPLIYKFGVIGPKLLSMLLFCSGSLMLGLVNPNIPLLIVPGIVLVGVGGLGIMVINMKVSTIIPIGAGLYVAVLNGACDSSVITFRIVKLLYESGIPTLYPFIGLIVLHVIISGSSLILHKVFDKPKKKTQYSHVPTKNVITTENDVDFEQNIELSPINICSDEIQDQTENPQVSLKDSLCSIRTLTLFIWMSILMLCFFFYLGSINTRLQNNFPEKVSHFTNVLAYIMFAGVVTAILPGTIAEWQISLFKGRKNTEEKRLMPNVLPQSTASILALLLTILSFIKLEVVLYLEFAVLTAFRSFLFSSNMAFVVSAYHLKHSNVILPLGLTIGGIISMTQIAIFLWFNQSQDAVIHVQIFMSLLITMSLVHPIVTCLTAKGVLARKTKL